MSENDDLHHDVEEAGLSTGYEELDRLGFRAPDPEDPEGVRGYSNTGGLQGLRSNLAEGSGAQEAPAQAPAPTPKLRDYGNTGVSLFERVCYLCLLFFAFSPPLN